MKIKKVMSLVGKSIFMSTMLVLFCGMGTSEESVSKALTPGYTELDTDAGIFEGILNDNGLTFNLTNISFSGKTVLKSIAHENDDSRTEIDLSQVQKLEVVNPTFTSKRYTNKEFALARITTRNGGIVGDLLIPRKISIGGIDKKTGMGKGWFMHTITNLQVQAAPQEIALPPLPEPRKVKEEKTGIIEKVKETGAKIVEGVQGMFSGE